MAERIPYRTSRMTADPAVFAAELRRLRAEVQRVNEEKGILEERLRYAEQWWTRTPASSSFARSSRMHQVSIEGDGAPRRRP